jgi:hypothetical protein
VTREQLEHAIRAACDVTGDTELWIFGSQAILAEFPNAPDSLRASIEVDVQPKNLPEAAEEIDGALGELSMFHRTHGFYVHGVSIEAATLPSDWKARVRPVRDPHTTRGNTGWCVEIHDLAASKLAAFREKDREFARTLLAEKMIDHAVLITRAKGLEVDSEHLERLLRWVRLTARELTSG